MITEACDEAVEVGDQTYICDLEPGHYGKHRDLHLNHAWSAEPTKGADDA